MIVVIGRLAGRLADGTTDVDGLAAGIAHASVTAGAACEIITKVGNDPAGDAVLLALGRAGVGHVATLRDPARVTAIRRPSADDLEAGAEAGTDRTDPAADDGPTLERADVELGLRYIPDIRAIVTVHAPAEVVAEAVAAALWSSAALVVVLGRDDDEPAALPGDALVVRADFDDGDSGLAGPLGRYAAALDSGGDRAAAYSALTAAGSA